MRALKQDRIKMKKTIYLLSGIILSAIVFNGCKKGDEDPFLSLKSRKARLEGDWKLNSGTETYVQPATLTNTSTTYTNSTAATTGSSFGFNVSQTVAYTLEIKIDKNGTYTKTENNDGDVTTEQGRWVFAGGAGDYKNKEQVVMSPTSITDKNGNTTTYTNNDYSAGYDLICLKSKKLHIKSSSITSSTTQTLDLTFTQ